MYLVVLAVGVDQPIVPLDVDLLCSKSVVGLNRKEQICEQCEKNRFIGYRSVR